MRIVKYREGRGRASNPARGNLNELAMLLEAAVALANVERWVQESVSRTARDKAGASIVPVDVSSGGKRGPYEVTVVDGFMRLAAVSFAVHGTEAVWERKFPTGHSVDVCLFSAKRQEEARVEFGYYTLGKLREDARKLAIDLPGSASHKVTNFVMLWRTYESGGVVASDHSWRNQCNKHAKKAAPDGHTVKLEVASEQDLFAPKSGDKKKVQVALFSVLPFGGAVGESERQVDLPL